MKHSSARDCSNSARLSSDTPSAKLSARAYCAAASRCAPDEAARSDPAQADAPTAPHASDRARQTPSVSPVSGLVSTPLVSIVNLENVEHPFHVKQPRAQTPARASRARSSRGRRGRGGRSPIAGQKKGISSPWRDANANSHGVNMHAKRLISLSNCYRRGACSSSSTPSIHPRSRSWRASRPRSRGIIDPLARIETPTRICERPPMLWRGVSHWHAQ